MHYCLYRAELNFRVNWSVREAKKQTRHILRGAADI